MSGGDEYGPADYRPPPRTGHLPGAGCSTVSLTQPPQSPPEAGIIMPSLRTRKQRLGEMRRHDWQLAGPGFEPRSFYFKAKTLGSDGSKSRTGGARKLVGPSNRDPSRNPYLDHRKHESARGPRRHRCHQNLRPWMGGHKSESDPWREEPPLPRPGDPWGRDCSGREARRGLGEPAVTSLCPPDAEHGARCLTELHCPLWSSQKS